MDVVKTNVERIGGTVDLKTEPGSGTTFKIKIPLTLAIIPALTVSCAGNRYAIPQVSLLELVRLEGQDRRIGSKTSTERPSTDCGGDCSPSSTCEPSWGPNRSSGRPPTSSF